MESSRPFTVRPAGSIVLMTTKLLLIVTAAIELATGVALYNISIPVLLTYAAAVEHLSGVAFWPASGLYSVLSVWCVACIRSRYP